MRIIQITQITQIIEYYKETFHTPSSQKIGIEWERFGIKKGQDGVISPAPYIGGYEKILNNMQQENNWKLLDEYDGYPFTLQRGSTLITTEGDGKPEISGSAFEDLNDAFAELEQIAKEIEQISKSLEIEWIESGLQPYNAVDQLPLAPKPRYETFLQIAEKNGYQKWMSMYMKAVSGLHINIDVDNVDDLLKKTQTCLRIAPLLCGIFANSPLEEGQKTGFLSARRKYISCEKCERSHMMKGILEDDFSLKKWIEWYIEQPMLVIIRGKETIITPQDFTFLDWMQDGFAHKGEKIFPTIEDFDVHLKTMWVDTRFRVGYLEFRPLDTLPIECLKGAVALFTGILYASEGHQLLKKITSNWQELDYKDAHEAAWTDGIHAEYKGVCFVSAGKELLALAQKTLLARGKGEEKFLKSVEFLLEHKTTPAEEFMKTKEGK